MPSLALGTAGLALRLASSAGNVTRKTPWYNWKHVENGVKHQTINQWIKQKINAVNKLYEPCHEKTNFV